MKAITLWQPWATFVARKIKLHETRPWSTKHRGELAIAAGKSPKGMAHLPSIWAAISDSLMQARFKDERWPRGVIVAVVDLCACTPTQEAIHHTQYDDEVLGDYRAGRFAWQLTSIRKLKKPVPCRGAQGLWTVPEDVEREVRAQLAGVRS